MSILNKFKKKKFIYIIPIVIAAFSINYAFSDLTQGQHGYNAINLSFDTATDLQGLGQINTCTATVGLAQDGSIFNTGAGSAKLSFDKGGSEKGACIITIQRDITPSTDAGVPTGNDWIDIDISFFYRIFSIDDIDAHWGQVRIQDEVCADPGGANVAIVEIDQDPADAGTFDFVATGTFVSHNPQGSAVLADLDPTAVRCAEIDIEIRATGGGSKSFVIFLDDILIEFSNESKTKINHDFQQGFSFQ